ncbi:MAG: hypothetical protein K2M10_09405, partial [Muribaculaceae bacterium]|nr:hypothetical protein [Muribaculaceae bacterium]
NRRGAEGYGSDAAIMAGADIVVAPVDTRKEIGRLLNLARSDHKVLTLIDDRCRRILFYKYLVSSESSGVSLRGLHEDVVGSSGVIRERLSE